MTERMSPPPPTDELVQLQVTIESTNRVVFVAMPRDLTDAELLEVAAWMTNPTGMRSDLRPPSPIILLSDHRPRPS